MKYELLIFLSYGIRYIYSVRSIIFVETDNFIIENYLALCLRGIYLVVPRSSLVAAG
jgi:hypothetical protein